MIHDAVVLERGYTIGIELYRSFTSQTLDASGGPTRRMRGDIQHMKKSIRHVNRFRNIKVSSVNMAQVKPWTRLDFSVPRLPIKTLAMIPGVVCLLYGFAY